MNPDPFTWVTPVVAGLLCGSVRALLDSNSKEIGGVRRFLGGFVSTPIASVLLTIAVILVPDVRAVVSGVSIDSSLGWGLYLFVFSVTFGLVAGTLIGIPVATISCTLVKEIRSLLNRSP